MRFWAVLFLAAGCAPHYDWVEEPATPASDEATSPRPPNASTGPCAASTPAVRQQARQGRYQGVEGFDSRGCIGPQTWEE